MTPVLLILDDLDQLPCVSDDVSREVLPPIELDDNLARTVVIDFFKLANVACTISRGQYCRERLNAVDQGMHQETCKISVNQYIGNLKDKGRGAGCDV